MSTILFPKKSSEKLSNVKSLVIVGGILAIVASNLFAYMMWYVSLEETTKYVKIIADTEKGCISETLDRFSTKIGACDSEPDELVLAVVDQKAKQRTIATNPS